MGSLIDNVLSDDFATVITNKHRSRVAAAGGVAGSRAFMTQWIRLLKSMGQYEPTKVIWADAMGGVIDPNVPGDTFSKCFSADAARNDLSQTPSKALQPLRVGQIQSLAEGLYNGNGAARFMTHPAVSFANGEPWTLSAVINWNGENSTGTLSGGLTQNATSTVNSVVALRRASTNRFSFRDVGATSFYTGAANIPNQLIGKSSPLFVVSNGTDLLFYIGANLVDTVSCGGNTGVNIQRIFSEYVNSLSMYSYRIQAGALSATQVASEAAFLTARFPEIPSVQIGTQTWAVQNFNAVCTPMGNVIPNVTDNAAWPSLTTPGWSAYNNDPNNEAIYGKLYNQYAGDLLTVDINTYNAANPTKPYGWHVPSEAEWTTLINYLGGAAVAGGKLKQIGTTNWNSPNTGATNESGFYALPGGFRRQDTGAFNSLQSIMQMWLTNNGRFGYVLNNSADALTTSIAKQRGCSIRLIKD